MYMDWYFPVHPNEAVLFVLGGKHSLSELLERMNTENGLVENCLILWAL